MLNVENRVIINPIELEGDTVFVPFQDEELEQEFLERRTAHGRVRWFKRSLGYGFVREDANDRRRDEVRRLKCKEIG